MIKIGSGWNVYELKLINLWRSCDSYIDTYGNLANHTTAFLRKFYYYEVIYVAWKWFNFLSSYENNYVFKGDTK